MNLHTLIAPERQIHAVCTENVQSYVSCQPGEEEQMIC
jgi:hypothetical protein